MLTRRTQRRLNNYRAEVKYLDGQLTKATIQRLAEGTPTW